ncbi:hypothetical protein RJT34_02584 [Clitoria ternatea]|uniref:Uncharacterized protein n=1 Tax=Clitoria ternatea TaxID=43366 RepID=A0AAN9KJ98_CLITE
MYLATNILRTQAIDGRTALRFECQEPTRSGESTRNEPPRGPNGKGKLIYQETVELCQKVYGTTDMVVTSRNVFLPLPNGIHAGGHPEELVQLQLCQPEQEAYETSGSGTK